MDGWVPIFFLMVVLKIPVGLLLYLVWWAFRAETSPEEAPETGNEEHRFGRFRRQPNPRALAAAARTPTRFQSPATATRLAATHARATHVRRVSA